MQNEQESELDITLLYVPANRPDRVEKALKSGADAIVIDLEDAIAPAHKHTARRQLREVARHLQSGVNVQVRINARGTPWHLDDLEACQQLGTHVSVRLPKVESSRDVLAVLEAVPGRQVHAIIETALGVEHAFEIAQSGVTSIGLGEADLRSQLGLPSGAEGDGGLAWPRSRLIVAAAAAGIRPPMMSVYTRLNDDEGLRASTREGRSQGFVGRAAIHPKQLVGIREAMRPKVTELEAARTVLERIDHAESVGVGVFVLDDGSFIDAAMMEGARRAVEIYDRTQ